MVTHCHVPQAPGVSRRERRRAVDPGGGGRVRRDVRGVTTEQDFVTEVIRPAAIVPEEAARSILVELSLSKVVGGGQWLSQPSRWDRYDHAWRGPDEPGGSRLMGSIQVAYGTPTKYEITIYRVTITRPGSELGWTVRSISDEALDFGGLTLAMCPRAEMFVPPKPFRF